MLKTRILTAFVLFLLLTVIFYFVHTPVFTVFLCLVFSLTVWEWGAFIPLRRKILRVFYFFLQLLFAYSAYRYLPLSFCLIFSTIFWAFLALFLIFNEKTQDYLCQSWLKVLMGFPVLFAWLFVLSYFTKDTLGLSFLLLLLFSIWTADTSAYFVGRYCWAYGKLAPRLSPNKSCTGFLASCCFSLLFLPLWIYVLGLSRFLFHVQFFGLMLIVVFFSAIGDLFESLMKRSVGLKDSGFILPGHGGLLDRLDSMTAALPIYAFGLMGLGLYF